MRDIKFRAWINIEEWNGYFHTDTPENDYIQFLLYQNGFSVVDCNYNYLKDNFNAKENQFSVSANIDYFFENEFIGIDSRISYYKTDQTIDTVNYALVQFNPWVGAFGKKWQIIIANLSL